jgi:putative transposase
MLGEGGLFKELDLCGDRTREQETELDSHLGYPKHGRKGHALGNSRNGHSQKTLKGEQGYMVIEVRSSRQGTGLTPTGQKGPNANGRHRSTKSWRCMHEV